MVQHTLRWFVAVLAAVALTSFGAGLPAAEKEGVKVVSTKVFRTSNLEGMKVRNLEREDVGTIHDLVLDAEKGKIEYAAVSVGGFLGIGDRLFAIPFGALTLKHDQDETYFVLDVSKEKMKAAPGFDKDKWPNVADPQWREQIDKYYMTKKVEQAKTTTTRK
jgi:sporulation protein YlmC with PRC-barrel domain